MKSQKRKRRWLRAMATIPPSEEATESTVPADIIEMLMERAGRTIVQETQLAAKQRRLLDMLSANAVRSLSKGLIR